MVVSRTTLGLSITGSRRAVLAAATRRGLISYAYYYHHTRTHLSLDKDCPDARSIQPPNRGKVIAIPQVGGLHHRYERARRLIRFRGLRSLRPWLPLCGKPCHSHAKIHMANTNYPE